MNLIKQSDLTPAVQRLKDLGLDEKQVKREISFALQIVNKSPQLLKCPPQTIAAAVANIANIGLSLNPVMNEAYLIPRWDSLTKGMVAHLEPGYKGLQKLAMLAGAVKRMNTQIVYSEDVFEIDLADDQRPVVHRPKLGSDRGDILGAYCLSTLPDGFKQVEWMEYMDIKEVREASESWKAYQGKKIPTCVWVDHEGEMIRKTVIRRAVKYLPKVDSRELSAAIELDNSDYRASTEQLMFAESLLNRSNIDPDEQDRIDRQIRNGMSRMEAQSLIMYLQENQLPDNPAYDGSMQKTKLAKAANDRASEVNS